MEPTPVRIEELLAHAGWVRRLAARLVRDTGTADDVAQEVWAYALRSPPRDRTNLRAWLSAAVRNAARSLSRSETRRSAREADIPPRGHAPAAAELVERAHLHRDLVEQVLALDEPHRSLVLSHWFEGQSVAEIARRLGLTERVAKSRLDEALAILRQRMDEAAGGRAVWSLAFLKWTQPELAAAGAGTALTLGGIAVGTKLAVGSLAVALAAGLGWYFWPQSEPSAPVASSLATPEAQVAKPEAGSSELAPSTSVSSRETIAASEPAKAAAPVVSEKRWIVRGHVKAAPAVRLAETRVSAVFVGRYNIQDGANAMAGADGSFELDLTAAVATWLRNAEPNELVVTADHPLCLDVEARLPFTKEGEHRCDLALESAAVACGRIVVPADWKPEQLPGWAPIRPRVAIFDGFAGTAAGTSEGLDRAVCDPEGTWTLKSNRGGSFTLVACAGGLRPRSLSVELVLGQRTEIAPLELGRGESLSGTVRRAGRAVGKGITVAANLKSRGRESIVIHSPDNQPSYLTNLAGGWEYTSVFARTLEDGRYRLEGLAPVEYELEIDGVPDIRAGLGGRRHAERTVRATQDGIDLDGVPPTIEIALTVGGRPPTDADLEGIHLDMVPLSKDSTDADIDLTRGARGYGKIQVIAGVAYELRVRPGKYAPSVLSIGALAAGEERTFPLDLKLQDQGSTLVVTFVSDRPLTMRGAQFGFTDPADERGERIQWLGAERSEAGSFILRDHTPGSFRVHVRPYEAWDIGIDNYLVPTAFDVVLKPKATLEHELRLETGGRVRLSAKDAHGGYVRAPIELRDAGGQTIPTEFYCVTAGMRYGCGWYLCEQGPNDHPALPAGHYEFTLKAEGFAPEVVPVDLVAGETKTLDVVLHPR